MTTRLQNLDGLPASVIRPAYRRDALTAGILHLGPGAFFRAHLAVYTDDVLAKDNRWSIEAVSLRSTDVVDHLNEQNGLYTLLTRDTAGTTARVIGSISKAHAASRDPAGLLKRLADPAIRIVSLTVTEKAYGLDLRTGGLDLAHPDIAADLANPTQPRGVIGYIVAGLAARRAQGLNPFTPLSCDNLPGNGAVLKRLTLEFAERTDPSLRRWIEETIPFPSTMVDRITPASTDETYADAQRLTGHADRAAIETEPFSQWVIEDHFVDGRPAWDEAGALMVSDVSAYEKMKLRMLNGAHSLLAYLGFIAGHEFIRDTMQDAALKSLAERHMKAAARTLDTLSGIDFNDYAHALIARFENRAIAHRTYQIAMDGTQKLPQRLLQPAAEALARGEDGETFAIAVAGWMRYAVGIDREGRPYGLRDPRAAEITTVLNNVVRDGRGVSRALFALPGLFPDSLTRDAEWTAKVEQALNKLLVENCVD